jgi:hypothetical protein
MLYHLNLLEMEKSQHFAEEALRVAQRLKFADSPAGGELDSNFPYASAMNLVSPSQSQHARN